MSRMLICSAIVVATSATALAETSPTVAITTSSEAARALYLKGRDLVEKLRVTDAHALFGQAIAKDKNFALAYLGFANTSGTTKEFFDAIGHAVAEVDKATPGEQWLVRAAEAGAKADPTHQKEYLDKLAAAFPKDVRVQNQ